MTSAKYHIRLTGPVDTIIEAQDELMGAGYDTEATDGGSIVAYGDCPHSAAPAVDDLGWRVESYVETAMLNDMAELEQASDAFMGKAA